MAFSVPPMIRGHPKLLRLSIHPAAIGGSAPARLRGTFVTLAAAGRSSGETTAITYDVRAGTSICESADRPSRHATASGAFGMNAVRMRRPFAGRWVNTIVRTRPIRPARRTAASWEKAANNPAQKKTAPLTASDKPNRRCSQSTTSAVITNPPPNASRLNSAASR